MVTPYTLCTSPRSIVTYRVSAHELTVPYGLFVHSPGVCTLSTSISADPPLTPGPTITNAPMSSSTASDGMICLSSPYTSISRK